MKINGATILLVLLNFSSFNSFSQELKELSLDQYDVINSLFSKNENEKYLQLTDNSKTWNLLLSSSELDNLLGPPCNDGIKIIEWDNLLSKKDFEKIRREIIHSAPITLDSSKLNPKIKLVKNNSSHEYNAREIASISSPIIIDDLAIIKKSSYLSEMIIIAKRSENGWKSLCVKWTYQISID